MFLEVVKSPEDAEIFLHLFAKATKHLKDNSPLLSY